jgi:hypothetical protein
MKNSVLLFENMLVWGGVITSFFLAVLPIVQVFAATAAFIFSILSIIKMINNWDKKNV